MLLQGCMLAGGCRVTQQAESVPHHAQGDGAIDEGEEEQHAEHRAIEALCPRPVIPALLLL